ncbi:MAG: hypothetical protein PHP44_08405 [Kiritimatiellae bacterium]|nr:hypothetical protein [Kiritimatiellia bacterium]
MHHTHSQPVRSIPHILLLLFMLCLSSYPLLAENGPWTNCAGQKLNATPIALDGKQITFQLAETLNTVKYPLSIFPSEEQIRLKQALGITHIPDELKTTYEFSLRSLERLNSLHRKRKVEDADYQTERSHILQQFRDQALPLIQQNKLTAKQLETLLSQLGSQ